MSSVGSPRPGLPQELDGLELAVRRLLDDDRGWRRRAAAAEKRAQELEAVVAQLRAAGNLDPVALRRRVEQLEAENRDLQARLTEAAERVRRLLARASFLEEER